MSEEIDTLFLQAQYYHRAGELDQALPLYQSILDRVPTHVDSLSMMGLIAASQKQYDLARKLLCDALVLAPGDAAIHNNLANVYKHLDCSDDAIVHYRRAIELNPDHVDAMNNLACLYEVSHRRKLALEYYTKAVHVRPDYLTAHMNLALFFIKGQQFDNALKQLNNVIALAPEMISAHYYLGNIYLSQDKLEQAQQHYEHVLEQHPEHVDSLCNMGTIYLKQDKPQRAIDYFTKALAIDNDNIDARNNLAATFIQYDRYENAIKHYQELLKVESDSVEYNFNMAVAHMALGRLHDAIFYFEQVLAKAPCHHDSLLNVAAIYLRLEEKSLAQEIYQRMLAHFPDQPIASYMLAAIRGDREVTSTPQSYVENLFDNYAVQYDKHLSDHLHYKVPFAIKDCLSTQLAIAPAKQWTILDLGCGTGLAGEVLAPYASSLVGVDLSPKMLAKAQEKGFYQQLICQDIIDYLEVSSGCFDCICAADVLSYIGDLSSLFNALKPRLSAGGLFVFSIEASTGASLLLQQSARFAHHPEYIQALAKQHILSIALKHGFIARTQNDVPVEAFLFILRQHHKY